MNVVEERKEDRLCSIETDDDSMRETMPEEEPISQNAKKISALRKSSENFKLIQTFSPKHSPTSSLRGTEERRKFL